MEIIPTSKIINRDGIKAIKNGQKLKTLLTIGQGRVAQKYLEQNQEALFN